MKKILLVILTLTIVFGLGACDSAPTEEYATKSELQLLEEEIQALQERIDNLVVVKGLNGQVSIYENQTLKDELDLKLVTLSLEMMVVKDTFDKAKDAPDYIKDEFGGYVSFEDLGMLLKQKYFNTLSITTSDIFEIGSQAYIQIWLGDTNLTNDDILARTILLIEEVRNYDFYVLSCNELEVYIMFTNDNGNDSRISVNIPLVVIINNYFEITPNGILDGDYEMELWTFNANVIELNVQTLYDDYKTNLTYDGFVLNYTIK
jgi:hypothetical protein